MIRNLYDLNHIRHDNYRPIDEEAVENLTRSIKEVGLQEPISLFEVQETRVMYVISGHHRLEAMKNVMRDPDHDQVFKAWVTRGTEEEYQSQKTAVQSVMANMLRTDLGLLDRAAAYRRLRDSGLSASAIAGMVNRDKRTIEMTLNVSLLPEDVKAWIRSHKKIKDSVVYRLAAQKKRQPDLDVMYELIKSQRPQHKKIKRLSVQPERLSRALAAEGLNQGQIDRVLAAL